MEQVNRNQKERGIIKWLSGICRNIVFADYESAGYLQDVVSGKLRDTSTGTIEAAIHKRSQAVKLWYNIIPLCFLFFPLWLLWVIPLFKEPLPPKQVAIIVATILITATCYLLTFYNDSIRFRSNLIQVRGNLLALLHKEPATNLQQEIKITAAVPKGSIRMLLLDQLVRREAGCSSIFNAPVEAIIPFWKKLVGFDEKNFKKVMQQYRRRQDIVLDRENMRTTHIGYLDVLISYYNEINEPLLAQQASSLQNYLNTAALHGASKNLMER